MAKNAVEYNLVYYTVPTGTRVVIFGVMVPTLKSRNFLTFYLPRTTPVTLERPWRDLFLAQILSKIDHWLDYYKALKLTFHDHQFWNQSVRCFQIVYSIIQWA